MIKSFFNIKLLDLYKRRIFYYNSISPMTTKEYKQDTADFIKSTDDIPDNLKEILPAHAQHIYMKSHNHAIKQYQDPKSRKYGGTLEEVAHRVAWAAVKSMYEKDEKTGMWKIKPGKHEKDEPEYEEDPDV